MCLAPSRLCGCLPRRAAPRHDFPEAEYVDEGDNSLSVDKLIRAFRYLCHESFLCLNRNPLDLIQRDPVTRAVVELCRSRAFVRCHGLGVLQSATSFEVCSDARGPKRMTSNPDLHGKPRRAALDHAPGVDPVHRLVRQRAGATGGGAEQGSLAGITETGRLYIGVEIGFEVVVRRHLMPLAAFLMQADPPALALGVVVLDVHGDDSADAGEGEGHDADQRPVAQPDHGRGVDAVQQPARLFGVQHRGLAGLDHMLRAADRMGGVGGHDLAGDQPVEQHADGCQVLLDRRFLEILAKRLDIGRHMQRLDIGELAELVMLAPGEEPAGGMQVGCPGVAVADGGGEEFEEAAGGLLAGVGDHRRHDDGSRDGGGDPRCLGGRDDGQLGGLLGHGFSVT